MDKSSGANATQGAAGQNNLAGGVETHPAGTAERLRRLGIIGARAAQIIEGLARDLKDTETINGEWPADPGACTAQIAYEEWTATAGYLRALCAPPAAAPEAEPVDLPDEDFTVPIYPWPSGEVENIDEPIPASESAVKFDPEGMVIKIITEDVRRGSGMGLRGDEVPRCTDHLYEAYRRWAQGEGPAILRRGDVVLTPEQQKELEEKDKDKT